jgi:hypothetical protein
MRLSGLRFQSGILIKEELVENVKDVRTMGSNRDEITEESTSSIVSPTLPDRVIEPSNEIKTKDEKNLLVR